MRRRAWIRWPAAALLLLTGGLAMNVGVAWACAVAAASLGAGMKSTPLANVDHVATDSYSEGFALVEVAPSFGYRRVMAITTQSGRTSGGRYTGADEEPLPGVSWESPRVRVRDGSGEWSEGSVPRWMLEGRREGKTGLRIAGAGWPLVSLWSVHDHGSLRVGLDLGRADMRPLPVRPVWRGMVVNTAVYAVLLSPLLLFAPARRRLRLRRGRCPRCGYELGEAAGGCPECGWGRAERGARA